MAADEPSWDDIFASQPGAAERRPARRTTSALPDSAPDATPASQPRSRREARESEARESGARDVGARERAVDGATVATPAPAPAQSSPPSRADVRGPRGPREPKRKKPRTGLRWLWALLATVLVLGVGVGAVWMAFGPQIQSLMASNAPTDYEGTGNGEAIVVTVTNGQVGGDVAQTLADSGVTMSYSAFYSLLLERPDVTFTPGSYQLQGEMSAASALDALLDPANQVQTQLAIPEGTTVAGVVARLSDLSESTGIAAEDIQAAVADYTTYGIPAEAPSLEGYLFPATYQVQPGATARDVVQMMVTEMFTRLDALGVAPDDRHRVLTLAALTQKEGGSSNDFFKVARVWENRIAEGMNLQSDATVSYGVGGTTIETTQAERDDSSNPYNTYANPGLPVGPISNPGEDAIEATIAPAEGDWLYFVLVNAETGETVFSADYDDHLVGVAQWQAWLRDHPEYG